MFLLDWYRQYLEIKQDYKSRQTELTREVKQVELCQSCETLREQLMMERQNNQRLLDRVLEKPEKPVDTPHVASGRPILPLRSPWKVRQQMLETEDREKARALKAAPKPSPTDVADLEKELDIASAERTTEAVNQNAQH